MKATLEVVKINEDVITASLGCTPMDCDDCYSTDHIIGPTYCFKDQ